MLLKKRLAKHSKPKIVFQNKTESAQFVISVMLAFSGENIIEVTHRLVLSIKPNKSTFVKHCTRRFWMKHLAVIKEMPRL
jgi:hypothetical protein